MAKNQRDMFGGAPTPVEGTEGQLRAGLMAPTQMERVLAVLIEKHPNPISHKELAEQSGVFRVCNRIKELVDVGWQIEGANQLGLHEVNQTQLYRLASMSQGHHLVKHYGVSVRWTNDEGLVVNMHRDGRGDIPKHTQRDITARLRQWLLTELAPLISAPPTRPDPEAAGRQSLIE